MLVVQKTGWGKSYVYFIATKMLREQGEGPALLISPLLSLMRNQIAAAQRMGVRASTINSEHNDDWRMVEVALERNEVDLLLISQTINVLHNFFLCALCVLCGYFNGRI